MLAPADGIARCREQRTTAIPSRRESDCRACHEGAAVPVLGFSALQLSSDRDPLAPHADARTRLDLRRRSWRADSISNLPPALLTRRRASKRLADRARRARLPARQLRPLPQRRRHARARRPDARAERRRRAQRSDRVLRSLIDCRQPLPRARALAQSADASRPAARKRAVVRDALARSAAPDAAARHPSLDSRSAGAHERWIEHHPHEGRRSHDSCMTACRSSLCRVSRLTPVRAGRRATPTRSRAASISSRSPAATTATRRGRWARRPGAGHEPHALGSSGEHGDHSARADCRTGPWIVAAAATNTAWSGPWGVSFTANLTPDAETGLGKWTLRNFIADDPHRPSHGPRPPDPAADADPDVQALHRRGSGSDLRLPADASRRCRNRVPEPLPPAATAAAAEKRADFPAPAALPPHDPFNVRRST